MPITRGPGGPGATQLLAHVLLLQRLHGVPGEPQLLGHVSDRRGPTAPAHVEREPLGVEGIVGQKGEPFLLHRATAPAGHAPDLDLEVDAQIAAGQVADAALPAVVPPALDPAAGPTGRFFDRRVRASTRAGGSPKIPTTVELGRKPAKRYVSQSRRGRGGVGMPVSCLILEPSLQPSRPLPERVPAPSAPCFHPLTSTKSLSCRNNIDPWQSVPA